MATSWDPVLAKRHGNKLKAVPVVAEAEADIRKRLAAEETQRRPNTVKPIFMTGPLSCFNEMNS